MTPALIIALEFGPVQTTGAFRSIDLARHLPEHGFAPEVVAIEPAHGARIFSASINEGMLAGVAESVAVHRLVPDGSHGQESRLQQFVRIATSLDDGFDRRFRGPLDALLGRLAGSRRFEVVYVSAPPFGAARLGERAAATLGVPLVLDMRDAWAEWGMAAYPTYLHYLARRAGERRAFRSAAAVVTVTDRLADVFRRSHPDQSPAKFHVVANGFDGPLVNASSSAVKAFVGANVGANVEPQKATFDVAYVGSFYYMPPKPLTLSRPHRLLQYRRAAEDWSYRSPLYFFKAWQALDRMAPETGRRLRFHHIGVVPPWLMAMAAEHGLADRVKTWGVLPKQALNGTLSGMDAQLATSMKRSDGGDYCLASKTFDYILARKPILAFVTEGSQRDFLVGSGAALICDPDDEQAGAAAIAQLMAGKVRLSLDADFVNGYHRREAARRMADVLRGAIERAKQPAAARAMQRDRLQGA